MSKSYTSYRLRHLLKVSSRATVLLRFDPPPPPSFFPAPRKNSMCIYIYIGRMLEMYIRTKKFLLKVEYLEKGGGSSPRGIDSKCSISRIYFMTRIIRIQLSIWSLNSAIFLSLLFLEDSAAPNSSIRDRLSIEICRFFSSTLFLHYLSLSFYIYIYIEERVQSALILSHGQA